MDNLYLIIGEDKIATNFEFQNIIKKLSINEESKVIYDLSISSLSLVLDEASIMNLFANQKLIIGLNFDLNKLTENDTEYLKKYLKSINKDVYIILIATKIDARKTTYKILKDNFTIIDTTKSNNTDNAFNYIKDIIKEKKYQMSDININYFLSKTTCDINNIDSELSKLMIYKQADKKITEQDIDLLIANNVDNIVYEFTNAIIENDLDKITSMYNNFKIQNVSFDYLISILANNFHQLLVIKILANEGKSNLEISKVIGKKEFYVKKNLERLYQYTTKDLSDYINSLATIDRNFKTGKSHTDELELFLLKK